MDWTHVLAFTLGLIVVPLGVLIHAFTVWARGRQWSGGGCDICAADNNGAGGFQGWVAKSFEPGEVNRLTFWLHDKAHRFYTSRKWHKKALGDLWRTGRFSRDWDSRYML